MWFLWLIFSIILIVFGFYLIYLRGKSLQNTWDSIFSVVKRKKLKIDSIRNLSERDINSVLIQYQQEKYVEIREPNKILGFKNILKDAKVAKIKYSYIPESVKIKVLASGDEIILDAFVLSSEDTDVFLELLPEYRKYVICLPGLKSWLNKEKDF
ncbi:MAG: hypothetical protein ABSB91_05785 [Sedimentisphaerales bacterium]|jgi:hypothetical protein